MIAPYSDGFQEESVVCKATQIFILKNPKHIFNKINIFVYLCMGGYPDMSACNFVCTFVLYSQVIKSSGERFHGIQ